MATTLTFVLTDARIPPAALHRALDRACARTYNAISVDGDQSTNDMILVMASGRAKQRGGTAAFEAALTDLLDDLSRQLMRGGEGVHHLVEVRVRGARSQAAATQVARAIGNSPLVKTAIAGGDPNWGRILMAAGNAGVKLDPRRLRLWFDKVQMVDQGTVCPGRNLERRVAAVMQRGEYTITLDLGAGRASAHCLTCDLSHEYVTINADYRT